ncbi:MAG: acyl-CoA dehydrogenase [Candidimonas sp.]|nr:MAG: acyl-CoA dehydrogenase [Candidimonas sp.]TAM25151.1 MAG: acyl-CoA dehydrogenase [Candidimonas sp.]
MNNRPHGHELLEIARHTLLAELLPVLPPGKNYEARMVANAMAVAAREQQAHGSVEREGARLIAAFFQGVDAAPAPTEEALAGLIRRREIVPTRVLQLHELLVALTRMKLAISNPKYLSDH